MPLYNSAHYSGATLVPPRAAGEVYQDKYGQAPRLAFSVAPLTAIAIGYDTVSLAWAAPEGDYTKIRLLRSQDGFSETEEDGIILWEWDETFGGPVLSSFEDSPSTTQISLVSGRFAYYRIWIQKKFSNIWVVAGDVYTIVPKAHNSTTDSGAELVSTHDKFMDMLPRVFTSATQSPLDVVDTSSDLYRFLQGFSFTLDEIMTLADNVLPEESGRYLNPELIGLKTLNFGLDPEAYIATKNQKRLIREAVYMFSNKGTAKSIETYVESLTGFAPVLTVSPNLFLSTQDSSFYKGLGFWKVVGSGSLELEQTVLTPSTTVEPNAIDTAYCAKLVTSSANVKVANGTQNPRTTGVPITAGKEYVFSFYTQASGSANTVTPKIYWYDYLGNLITTKEGTSSAVPAGSWAKAEVSGMAPGKLLTVNTYSRSSDTVTLSVDEIVNGYYVGDEVQVFGVNAAVDGDYVLTSVSSSSVSYVKAGADISATSVDSGTVMLQTHPAAFVGVELKIGSAGTVWLDMMQVAEYGVEKYYEARAVDVFLKPKKTNELKNPSFDDDAGAVLWTVAPGATGTYVDSTWAGEIGSRMLEVTTNPSGVTTISADTGIIETGRYYTFSLYMKAKTAGQSETVQLKINTYDAAATAGQEIANVHTSSELTPIVLTDVWTRYHVSGFIAASANPVYLQATVTGTTTGNVIQLEAAQVESAYKPTDYFDGDSPASFGAVWQGTANASRSHIYPNKLVKVSRLADTLRDFLPIGRAYTVRTHAGIEAKVI